MSPEELKKAVDTLRNLETQVNRIIADFPPTVETEIRVLELTTMESGPHEMLQINVRERLL